MSKSKYKWLVPEEIPEPLRFVRKRGEYDECLEEFLKSGLPSARVNIPNTKPKNVWSQLRRRVKNKGLRDKVKVSIRGDKVYLLRVGKEA